MDTKQKIKIFHNAITATLSLLLLYFTIITLISGFKFALSQMVEATILIDNLGEKYKPLRWEGAEPGGHYREGILIFAPIKPYPQHLNLIIKDIGDKDRSFAWILNGE